MLLRASWGHGKNQSIVVQFTSVGKVLNLLLKDSPTGENVSTKWRFFLHSPIKNKYFSLGVPGADISSNNLTFSSSENKLGTSPLLSILHISSK